MRRLPGLIFGALLALAPVVANAVTYSRAVCLVTGGATTSPFTLATLLPNWDNTSNRVSVVGHGGDGFVGTSGQGAGGGGGGGYNFQTNATLTGPTIGFSFNTQGTGTWVCGANTSCTALNTAGVQVSAKGGTNASGASGAAGGGTSSNIPLANAVAGGIGGSSGASKGGGGGGSSPGPGVAYAGGAAGVGAAGVTTGTHFGAGGTGDGGLGGAGGASAAAAGTAGTEAVTCDATLGDVHGAIGIGGGGAGGDTTGSINGGNGADYGGGGGGAFFGGTAGTGAKSLIIFEWNPTGGSARRPKSCTLLGVC